MTPPERQIIFVVNPGSTSTKLAVFEGEKELKREVLPSMPASGRGIWEAFDSRLEAVRRWFAETGEHPSAIAGLGGLLKPVRGGTYRVNAQMINDAKRNLQGEHASNLGCVLAHELSLEYRCPAFVVDPVSTDEFESPARYSGHPDIERRSLSHALNIHAAARRASHELGLSLESSSFVVAHLGGGISVAPVRNGRIVDANDASSDGPFSPERTGGLPLQAVISLAFSGKKSEAEMRTMVMGGGGLVAYLGTKNAEEVEKRMKAGDEKAKEVFEAMAYQISKEIGAMAAVLAGACDAVILTGGLAVSHMLTGLIERRVRFLGPILIYPGEHELLALALGTLRVLKGEERALEY